MPDLTGAISNSVGRNVTSLIRRSEPRDNTVITSAQQDDLFALTDAHQLDKPSA